MGFVYRRAGSQTIYFRFCQRRFIPTISGLAKKKAFAVLEQSIKNIIRKFSTFYKNPGTKER